MTAGKNQAEPVILKAVLFIGLFRRVALLFEISRQLVLRGIKSCSSTQGINGFESGRRDQPWSRAPGYSTARPQAQRSRKGFVHCLLGKIKITQQADQSCQDSSRFRSVKSLNGLAELFRHRQHLSQTSKQSGLTQLRSSGWFLVNSSSFSPFETVVSTEYWSKKSCAQRQRKQLRNKAVGFYCSFRIRSYKIACSFGFVGRCFRWDYFRIADRPPA